MSLTPEAEAQRETMIAAAISERKIRPSDAPSMRQLHASQPAAMVQLLTAADAYPTGWLSPAERAVAAGEQRPSSNRVQVEQAHCSTWTRFEGGRCSPAATARSLGLSQSCG